MAQPPDRQEPTSQGEHAPEDQSEAENIDLPASDTGDPVVDLRDETLLDTGAPEVYREGDQVILDLRELAPTGRTIADGHPRSGRPPDLLPHHHVVTITGGDQWTAAERFVYDIYRSLGYTAESSRGQVEELARFADRSRFHAVVDDDGTIVGTTRSIFGSYGDLPIGKLTRVNFEDADPMCELSSIVVDPSVRSRGIIEHLYREGWSTGTRMGAKSIAGVGEKWLLDAFRNTYALPFIPVGIPEWYMGGEVIPMIMANDLASHLELISKNPSYAYWNLEALTDEEIDNLGLGALVASRPRVP